MIYNPDLYFLCLHLIFPYLIAHTLSFIVYYHLFNFLSIAILIMLFCYQFSHVICQWIFNALIYFMVILHFPHPTLYDLTLQVYGDSCRTASQPHVSILQATVLCNRKAPECQSTIATVLSLPAQILPEAPVTDPHFHKHRSWLNSFASRGRLGWRGRAMRIYYICW